MMCREVVDDTENAPVHYGQRNFYSLARRYELTTVDVQD